MWCATYCTGVVVCAGVLRTAVYELWVSRRALHCPAMWFANAAPQRVLCVLVCRGVSLSSCAQGCFALFVSTLFPLLPLFHCTFHLHRPIQDPTPMGGGRMGEFEARQKFVDLKSTSKFLAPFTNFTQPPARWGWVSKPLIPWRVRPASAPVPGPCSSPRVPKSLRSSRRHKRCNSTSSASSRNSCRSSRCVGVRRRDRILVLEGASVPGWHGTKPPSDSQCACLT